MQREVIIDLAEQSAARSLSTLHPVERGIREGAIGLSAEERILLALVQQLEAIRLTIMALVAAEGD